MKHKYIDLKQIRPFVRFVLSTANLIHSSYVVPLEHRIIYAESGNADAWVDGHYYKMNKNDILYVSAGVPYKIVAEKDAVILVMYFDLTMENSGFHERIKPIGISDENNIPEYLTERYICKYRLKDKNNEIRFLYTKEKTMISLWLNEIRQYLNLGEESAYSECVISGFMVSIISKMLDNNSNFIKQESSDVVNLVLAYIHSRYNENITLDDISLALNFHKNYLNYCMKKATGLSIHKYLINFRLSRAMDFFIYTNLSIAEVSEKVGFKDSKSFAVAFKKCFSIPPSKVKKQVKTTERITKDE